MFSNRRDGTQRHRRSAAGRWSVLGSPARRTETLEAENCRAPRATGTARFPREGALGSGEVASWMIPTAMQLLKRAIHCPKIATFLKVLRTT
uniref:Uncharacterized protein n=1 Tax=Arundo donax TaxID=35708 RepID=A0A0A9SZV3_ARUDO